MNKFFWKIKGNIFFFEGGGGGVSYITTAVVTHFTDYILIANHIQWQIDFPLIQALTKWSLSNFAHDTIYVLLWHVQ